MSELSGVVELVRRDHEGPTRGAHRQAPGRSRVLHHIAHLAEGLEEAPAVVPRVRVVVVVLDHDHAGDAEAGVGLVLLAPEARHALGHYQAPNVLLWSAVLLAVAPGLREEQLQ